MQWNLLLALTIVLASSSVSSATMPKCATLRNYLTGIAVRVFILELGMKGNGFALTHLKIPLHCLTKLHN
jgi:hypothetical protein